MSISSLISSSRCRPAPRMRSNAVPVLLAQVRHLQQLGEPEHGVQRRAQLMARAGQEGVLRLGGLQRHVPGGGQLGGAAVQEPLGARQRGHQPADFVPRAAHWIKVLTRAQPVRVRAGLGDALGDARGEQHAADHTREHAEGQAGDDNRVDVIFQPVYSVAADRDKGVRPLDQATELLPERVHGRLARFELRPQGHVLDALTGLGPQLREFGHLAGGGRFRDACRRGDPLGRGRRTERGQVRGHALYGDAVGIEEQPVAGRGVAEDACLRVDRVCQDLVRGINEAVGGRGHMAFLPLALQQHQGRGGEADQGDQRDRDHDHALGPHRHVEPPAPQAAAWGVCRRHFVHPAPLHRAPPC